MCELLRANLYEFQKYNKESGDELYFTNARIQRIATQVSGAVLTIWLVVGWASRHRCIQVVHTCIFVKHGFFLFAV